VAAVDEHSELYGSRAAEVGQRVKGSPNRTAGKQDVVDQDDHPAVNASRRDLGVLQSPGRSKTQVVAIHRDVERAEGHRGALNIRNAVGKTPREGHSPSRNPEQDDSRGAFVALDNFVRDARQCALDLGWLKDRSSD